MPSESPVALAPEGRIMRKVVTNGLHEGADEKPSGSLTDQILERFAQSLGKSGKFDQKTVTSLLELARAQAKPKAKDFEKLIEQEESLE